jgi:hypothetical protein
MDKTSNQTTPVSGSVERLLALGPRPLIPGEDPAAYDAHLDRVADALKPVDYIGEMMVRDIADIDWEVLRLRGLNSQYLTNKTNERLRDAYEANGKWVGDSQSIRSFAANAFAEDIDVFARIDHMIGTLELRRTAILREFDRHQAVVGDQRARVAQIADQTSRPAD